MQRRRDKEGEFDSICGGNGPDLELELDALAGLDEEAGGAVAEGLEAGRLGGGGVVGVPQGRTRLGPPFQPVLAHYHLVVVVVGGGVCGRGGVNGGAP